MLNVFRRQASNKAVDTAAQQQEPSVERGSADLVRAITSISQRSSSLGREAAEVRGVLDDTQKLASAQAQ